MKGYRTVANIKKISSCSMVRFLYDVAPIRPAIAITVNARKIYVMRTTVAP